MAAAAGEGSLLSCLPADSLLLGVLSLLGPRDLLSFGATCRAFRDVARSDYLWMALCSKAWAQHMPLVGHWRARLDSAQAFFRLLRSFVELVGPWTELGYEPRGSLTYITWGEVSLIGCKLVTPPSGFSPSEELTLKQQFEVVGFPDGSFKVDLVDRDMENSDSVAKFPAELVWMSKTEPTFLLKNSMRNGPISRFLFTRISVTGPKPQKELLGLWKGLYGLHGVELVNVSQNDGEIIGTKVLGDPNVPCGEVTFKADISSESSDIPNSLQQEVNQQLGNREFRILKLYEGFGRIANLNFEDPLWLPGFFLVSQSGSIAFLWGQMNFVVPFERLDLEALYQSEKRLAKVA